MFVYHADNSKYHKEAHVFVLITLGGNGSMCPADAVRLIGSEMLTQQFQALELE
jgi:hypothetical protein